jgi:hypothetical protein
MRYDGHVQMEDTDMTKKFYLYLDETTINGIVERYDGQVVTAGSGETMFEFPTEACLRQVAQEMRAAMVRTFVEEEGE